MNRHHPSVKEVMENESDYEWLDLAISGFYYGESVDCEYKSIDEVISSNLNIISKLCESDFGFYLFKSAVVSINYVDEMVIKNLEGDRPLGVINYYQDECANISLNITEKFYSNFISVLANNVKNLKIRLAIPKWKDPEIKVLPIMKYHIYFDKKHEI